MVKVTLGALELRAKIGASVWLLIAPVKLTKEVKQ
jgi:hypothetical protein